MDQERFMIIVKGDDKTLDVSSYEMDPPVVRIIYKGYPEVYTYKSSDTLTDSDRAGHNGGYGCFSR